MDVGVGGNIAKDEDGFGVGVATGCARFNNRQRAACGSFHEKRP